MENETIKTNADATSELIQGFQIPPGWVPNKQLGPTPVPVNHIEPPLFIESANTELFAAAFVEAQSHMDVAELDAKNPHYNSKFASYKSVYQACVPALNAAGIGMQHFPNTGDGSGKIEVITKLTHKSGQWQACRIRLPIQKADAQGVASAISYAKRYGLAAVAGVATGDEDDDGNAAVGKPMPAQRNVRAPAKPVGDYYDAGTDEVLGPPPPDDVPSIQLNEGPHPFLDVMLNAKSKAELIAVKPKIAALPSGPTRSMLQAAYNENLKRIEGTK